MKTEKEVDDSWKDYTGKRVEDTNERWDNVLFAVLMVASAAVLLIILHSLFASGYDQGYQQGQIDGLNGKWKYEVVVKPDTSYIAKPE